MKTALLIVDMQNDYFPEGKNELVNSVEASLKARELLEHFRQKGLPVIHIRHLSVRPGASFFLANTEGSEIHPNVRPLPDEKVIIKNFPNSFRETNLHEYLQQQQIDHLVVAGMMSDMCIDATVRAAKDLGYRVTVAANACATKNLAFQGQKIPALDVHRSFMAALNYYYAEIKNSDELIEQF